MRTADYLESTAPLSLAREVFIVVELPAAADELFAQEEEEARALGALLAVEWPERLSSAPAGCWQIQLSLSDPFNPEAGRLIEVRSPS